MKAIKEQTTVINTYLLWVILIAAIALGAYVAYSRTADHYKVQELQADNQEKNGLICQAELRTGHKGDVKSQYYIVETSAKQSDCDKYIDFKNIPDDTQSVWLGL